jgi:alanyl-tRNA synthetase
MTGADLREMFLKYFEERGHARVPSSSLVPQGDPTLLFTNAGMVQFKVVFTGGEKRPYTRATTAQKCLRVSGKHNDLENVGHTARHHTFFEMLGNFSFGDYFKEDAIAFGWEFLTKVVGLPAKKLHVTVYKDDDEALAIWRKVGGFKDRDIVRLAEKDNFWSMGDTGPCGPCSEIHMDQGKEIGCGRPDCAPGCDCDRFLELWNLVFMQYDRDGNGVMKPLPRPSIDTGLGLERLAAVVQGVTSNWESDLFRPIIARVEELSGKKCYGPDRDSVAIRVIADHSRAAAFLISDGILPSNEGRGYVLRRILRRALRYGKYIGLNEPFLYDTSLVVVRLMAAAYPELAENAVLVEKVIRNEEERFLETLARGLVLLDDETARVKASGGATLPGDVVFRLYDTYGFPPDLTEDLAREAGLGVDQAGFAAAMDAQRLKARQARIELQGEEAGAVGELLDTGVSTEFTGYETVEDSGIIKALMKDGKLVDAVREGDGVEVVTDRTPFYGESGGQVGDRGVISVDGSTMDVEDSVKPVPSLIIHRGRMKAGMLRLGDRVSLSVDPELRRATMANHSATHLLQWALRELLGDHVTQSGSLVEPQRLRFDFTHFSAISQEELERVEDLVNRKIQENAEVKARVMPIEEAKAEGAMALFGEKYGDTVRMVRMGDFSKELCGGTHTRRTGDIGLFKIVSEGGIAAGVRRIEAVTGTGAMEYVRGLEAQDRGGRELLKASAGELVPKLTRLIEEKKKLDRELEKTKERLVRTQIELDSLRTRVEGARIDSNLAAAGGRPEATDAGGDGRELGRVVALEVTSASSPKDLRTYADQLRDRLKDGVGLLGARSEDKVFLLALVGKNLTDRYDASHLIKKYAEIVGGSGGGQRRDMAQAGGKDVTRLGDAIEAFRQDMEKEFGAARSQ